MNTIARGIEGLRGQQITKRAGFAIKRMRPSLLATVIFTIILVFACCQYGSAADDDALFINPEGDVRVGKSLEVGGTVSAQAFKGDGAALNLEGNDLTRGLDEKKFDRTGGTVSGNVSIGSVNSRANLDVNGNVQVKGLVSSTGRYQRDDEPESTYEISPRYHLSLTGKNFAGKTRTIPHDILIALCGDPDGCQVRLGMTRWDNDSETETASVFFTFYYSPADGHWRASETDAGNAAGIDGDGRVAHVRNIWSICYFTDGTYSAYREIGDKEKGMQLLVWSGGKGQNNHPNRTCELTLID